MIEKNSESHKTHTNKQCLLNAISLFLNDKSIKHDSFELDKYADNLITFFTLLHETATNLKD